jgi:energy-coupling factor transporter ATP-binding protein EcfA2
MKNFLERLLARLWNRRISRRRRNPLIAARVLDLGLRFSEDAHVQGRITIPAGKRAEHIVILGRTGAGKSSLVKYIATQDIESGRGGIYIDQHGDATPFLVSLFAEKERALGSDQSEKLIVIEPADPDFSVGLNPLDQIRENDRFLQVAELVRILEDRWHMDTFGARTDELLRNALFVLAANGLTLLELTALLAHGAFRARCLKNVANAEVRQYFEVRYDQASEPMRAAMREPILNKVSAFTADPRFRHIVGQSCSTFSITEALDRGQWIILNLDKGRVGEQAVTLGSLFLAKIKNALFARERRDLVTVFADEIQNLASYGNGLETMLSEARKFGVGVVTANQFLEQFSPEMRAAIMAVGTHVHFQLSPQDAQQVATAVDGGKPLAELLKNLPRRHFVLKTGSERWQQGVVPKLAEPKVDATDLYNRCRARWGRKRTEIEKEIRKRQAAVTQSTKEALDGWD